MDFRYRRVSKLSLQIKTKYFVCIRIWLHARQLTDALDQIKLIIIRRLLSNVVSLKQILSNSRRCCVSEPKITYLDGDKIVNRMNFYGFSKTKQKRKNTRNNHAQAQKIAQIHAFGHKSTDKHEKCVRK